MAKRNSEYWKERMEALEGSQYSKSEEYYKDVQKQFRAAEKGIQMDIKYWYQRLAVNNGISFSDAKSLLKKDELEEFHWKVEEYIKKGQENAVNKRWMKELENASARHHISYLETMKLQAQHYVEVLSAQFEKGMTDFLHKSYEDAFYHTAYEIAKGTQVGSSLARMDTRRIDTIIKQPWAQDGKSFSDRIWLNKDKLVQNLHTELTQGIIRGTPPMQATENLAKIMKVSRSQAGRIVMTENAAISSRAQQDCFGELKIKQYEIVATLDSRTSKVCRDMDGKVFDQKDYQVGVTAPPFHPWCRTTTVPFFDDEFTEGEMRAARGKDGKTYYVPSDMTYKEWEKAFVNGGDKSGLKEVNMDDNAIDEYTASRKEYDAQVQKLVELEKETDNALDAYMGVIDTPQAIEYKAIFDEKIDETKSLKQIVKGLKAALSGKEVKAVRQVEKNLAVKTGIPIDKIEMSGLQYNTADMVFNSYKTVLNKYPELEGQLASFKYDGAKGNVYASCEMFTGEIQVHEIFSDYDKLVQIYARDVATGFHPVGTDHSSIIVHELGHALDGYMTKKGLLGASYNQDGALESASQTAKDMTLKFLGFDRQEITIELKSQGLTSSQWGDIINEREKNFIAEHVSRYAAENEKEFFAECFAEYVTSDNPREAAKIFGEIIDKSLGR